MGLNRTAKGIVLVPSLLLGSAFLAAAAWGDAAGANRNLALSLGGVLLLAGLLAQLFPESAEGAAEADEQPPSRTRRAAGSHANTGGPAAERPLERP